MDPSSAAVDWKSQVQPVNRHRIINRIVESMKKHPLSISGGPEGMSELKKITVRFEEEAYVVATSKDDYLRRISLEMLRLMDTRNPGGANHVPPNAGRRSQNPPDLVRRIAPKRRIPQTASYQSTNAARHLYPILKQGITIEVAQKLAQDVIHYLEDGIPLPDADAAASVQRRTRQRHDQNA